VSKSRKWTAEEITQLLRIRYSGDQWAFVSEVPNGTGTDMDRRCDGLAMCLWPSKGLYLHGHEIKVSRSDWLTEIQDVSKAAAFSRYCHFWWIVAPQGIVKLEELPSNWGLMCPSGRALRAKKPATLTSPEMPSHSLLAGMFRACCKASAAEEALRAARESGYSAGFADARRNDKTAKSDTDRRYEQLRRSVDEFEQASGITIAAYGGKQLGELVRLVESVQPKGIQNWLERLASELTRTHERVSQANTTLQELLR
jgi:hypothetical protein